ncbi:MAG: hypothetical protein M3Q55_09120 [Acidobacteriota bacterium]|nr:hypothetical protein [Acidobacteriota bacterium]
MSSDDERFERRLVEETSKLRVEAAGIETRLVDRVGQAEVAVRKDIGALEVRLVDRIAQSEGSLRQEMGALRADVLKWSFVFWIGQVVAMTAVMSSLLR